MTYTVTAKPMSDAFAAIQRFDPDAVIELEGADTLSETYTIVTVFSIDHLLDDSPGIIEWDEQSE